MSRSGYSEDLDEWASIRWRGAVASSIRGKRGQAFLRELLTALDAMEIKRLIPEELELAGEVCALGSLGSKRGIDMKKVDPEDNEAVARFFGIPHSLACELMYENDEVVWEETPEERYQRMHRYVSGLIKDQNP